MGLFDRVATTLVPGDAIPPETAAEIDEALSLADSGELASAEALLDALAERHPRVAAVQTALGQVRARRGDDEGAVTAFGRAVNVSVDAIDAWLSLGESLVRLGRGDPARDAFRRVLAGANDAPRRARAHAGRGRLARAAGRLAAAVRELRKATELAPADIGMAAELGRALIAVQDPEGWQWMLRAAQSAIDAAIDAAPDTLDDALVIEASRASPKRDAAESLLQAALSKTNLSPTARARLEAAFARQRADAGHVAEARALINSALGVAPDDPVVLESLGAIAEAAHEFDEALRAALRVGPSIAPEALIRLALGAANREALTEVSQRLPAEHPLASSWRAFTSGAATEDDLLRLGALAPDEQARRFVAHALAPAPVPEGNLFALLGFARELATHTPALAPLVPAAARAAEAFDRPLLIAVMGEFNAGKSSFVNAFCGQPIAPVGVTPTTATINVLRYGPPGGRVLYHDGRAEDLTAAAVPEFLANLGEADAAAVRMVEIFFPLDVLRRVEIVDTPGLNSLRAEHEQVARSFFVEADAIVWLFALGQAAKASEHDALGLARGAGKRVLGVLNKADQADPAEIATLLAHVRTAMGDRIEALLPLSARDAVRARGDEALLVKSGLPALTEALEERFFREARALKRQTALLSLSRFVEGARQLLDSASGAPETASDDDKRAALAASRRAVEGALAAERVRLRARLEEAFRRAAAEVLDFVRPRRWLFGERRAEVADEEFLFDLLEDAIVRATETTRETLRAAAEGGPEIRLDGAIDQFRAYARGVLGGGVVARFLHEDLPAAGGRVELANLQRSFARAVPDVEAELIAPLAHAIEMAHARASTALAQAALSSQMRTLLREERVGKPLEALARAIQSLSEPAAV